jgi:ribosomal-protein-alanine N-acetyltransferase
MNRSLSVRRMTADDLEAVLRIQQVSGPDSAAGWDPHDYLDLDAWVAESPGGVPLGFLVTRRVAPGEYEVLNMAVAPEVRRQGYAKTLLMNVLALRPGAWFLEVRASNLAAQALYTSLGFKPCGRRRNYYQAPLEDAIEMSNHS